MATPTILQIRTLVADPSGLDQIFDDDHYQELIDIGEGLYETAQMAATTLAAYFARKVDATAGPVSIKNSQKFDHYNELSDVYKKKAESLSNTISGVPIATGISISEADVVRADPDRYPNAFVSGQMNNPVDLGGGNDA